MRISWIIAVLLPLYGCSDLIYPLDRIKTEEDAIAIAKMVCPQYVLDAFEPWKATHRKDIWLVTKGPYVVGVEKRDGRANFCGDPGKVEY